MPAVHALRQALDVQRSTAQGIVAPARSAPAAASAPIADRVTLSSAARSLAAACGPCEGEPTDLEGALRSRAATGLPGAMRPDHSVGHASLSAEPVLVDLFA